MPEIPDLENFSRNLNKQFRGKKLVKVSVINGKKLKDSTKELKHALEKTNLKEVLRSGKQLRFRFSNNVMLGLHLMLHGDLYIFNKKNENKFTIVELLFENNKGLAITDWQGNANIKLNPADKEGLDALGPKLNFIFLKKALQSAGIIKNVITNQDVIRGLGNAYTDEILWEARISPFSISNAIPDEKIKQLSKAIKSVLKKAIKHIEKTHPDNVTGEIRDFLLIHNSKRKESPNGFEIKKQKKSGSQTYYTEEQVFYK